MAGFPDARCVLISSTLPLSDEPVGVPNLVQKIPTRRSQSFSTLSFISFCPLSPRSGAECVSHPTDVSTVFVDKECTSFHSQSNALPLSYRGIGENRVRARQRITKPSRLAKDQICTPLSGEKGGTCCHSSNSAAAEREGSLVEALGPAPPIARKGSVEKT